MYLLPIYTIWSRLKEESDDDAVLLEDEKIYKTRINAFKRAKELIKMNYYSGYVILVRRIRINSRMCKQWEFESEK